MLQNARGRGQKNCQPEEPGGPPEHLRVWWAPSDIRHQSTEDLLIVAKAVRRLHDNNKHNVHLCCGLLCGKS